MHDNCFCPQDTDNSIPIYPSRRSHRQRFSFPLRTFSDRLLSFSLKHKKEIMSSQFEDPIIPMTAYAEVDIAVDAIWVSQPLAGRQYSKAEDFNFLK
jgi:hypothetical protein